MRFSRGNSQAVFNITDIIGRCRCGRMRPASASLESWGDDECESHPPLTESLNEIVEEIILVFDSDRQAEQVRRAW